LKRGVAAAAVAALLLAACGGGGGKKAAKASSSSSTTETSTIVEGGTTTTVAGGGGGTATTAAKKTTATTSAAKVNGSSSSNYQPPAGSTPAKPATPGAYKYDTSGTSTFAGKSSTPPPITKLTIDPATGTRQHSTRDDRDSAGNGSVTETTLDYQPQGVFLVELKITTKALGITDVEDFVANPPVLAAPTGVKPGQSVEFDLSGSGTNVHVKIDFIRNERLTIGGQPVDTILTHQAATLSGKITGTTTSDSWASPQYSLFVKDHTVSDLTVYGSSAHSDITSQLQKLTPG
jgi:hypothetical protein